MTKAVLLESGNIFYYSPETTEVVATAMIVNPENKFLGGFAGKEATRKYHTFLNIGKEVSDANMPNIKELDIEVFCGWIGTAARLFSQNLTKLLNDVEIGGSNSISQACDERRHYFKAVGVDLFERNINCPLWALIANHVSIFGVKEFRKTFFKGREEDPQKDDVVENNSTRYSKESFKAPAYYLRQACQ